MNGFLTPAPLRLALLLSCGGCALGMRGTYPVDGPARAATETPERFLVGTIESGGAVSEPQPSSGCRNPMVDPRDGTRVTLRQSQRGPGGEVGDYAVPDGRYGVTAGELLRLDCSTGRVIGIIPNRS